MKYMWAILILNCNYCYYCFQRLNYKHLQQPGMMKATHEKHPLVELVVTPEKAIRGENVFQITVRDILTTVCQILYK